MIFLKPKAALTADNINKLQPLGAKCQRREIGSKIEEEQLKQILTSLIDHIS